MSCLPVLLLLGIGTGAGLRVFPLPSEDEEEEDEEDEEEEEEDLPPDFFTLAAFLEEEEEDEGEDEAAPLLAERALAAKFLVWAETSKWSIIWNRMLVSISILPWWRSSAPTFVVRIPWRCKKLMMAL